MVRAFVPWRAGLGFVTFFSFAFTTALRLPSGLLWTPWRFRKVLTQRHAVRFAGKLLQHGIVNSKLFLGIVASGKRIRHQACDLVALLGCGKCSQEFTSIADDRCVSTVVGIRLNQPGMQVRA